MSFSSRRTFLTQTAALVPIARTLSAFEPLTPDNLGVQLYTVRSIIDQDPAAVLTALSQIGFREVEATYNNLSATMKALKQTKLNPRSIHLDTALYFAKDASRLDKALDEVKGYGFEYAVFPYLPPNQRGRTVDRYKRLADILNKAGQKAKDKGLRFCYHNHAFEFQPMAGTTPLEIMLTATDKDVVGLEMDIFWVSVAGHDPVQLLSKYKGRVPLLHLKDKAKETPKMYNESVPKTAFKEVGSGSIDMGAVLKAADSAGVKHYFIEQDQTPADPLGSLRKSYRYLRSRLVS